MRFDKEPWDVGEGLDKFFEIHIKFHTKQLMQYLCFHKVILNS